MTGSTIAALEIVELLDPFNWILGACAPGAPGCVGGDHRIAEADSADLNNGAAGVAPRSASQMSESDQWSVMNDVIVGEGCMGRLDCKD